MAFPNQDKQSGKDFDSPAYRRLRRLDSPLPLDRRAKLEGQDLTGRFVVDLVLQVLAYVSQKELEDIQRRQAKRHRGGAGRVQKHRLQIRQKQERNK